MFDLIPWNNWLILTNTALIIGLYWRTRRVIVLKDSNHMNGIRHQLTSRKAKK